MDNATDASWVLHLPTLLSGPELAEDQRARGEKEVVTAIRAAHVSILQFLQPLGSYLTTESDLPRAKALNLLAKVNSNSSILQKLLFLLVLMTYMCH